MIFALAILAVVDLVVGVSNDAVNFLNSAIGSKAIAFKKIMIIASLGVFVGAVFSSGMMEVARKGIFTPSEFYFDEIMFIFMAVMIGDILLLDFFNTLGLPTSTTVSIVFNLLGAAVVMALIKIGMSETETAADLVKYINTEKAKQIISGILLSVVISFTIGMIVQWLSRLVFSFQYEKKSKELRFCLRRSVFNRYWVFHLLQRIERDPILRRDQRFSGAKHGTCYCSHVCFLDRTYVHPGQTFQNKRISYRFGYGYIWFSLGFCR